MKTAGIDYGMGATNRDPKTGIRYGIIPASDLSDWAMGEAEPIYPDNVDVECPECGHCWQTDNFCPDDDQACPECGHESQYDCLDMLEASGYDYAPNDPEYTAEHYGDGDDDIFITRSPYFTYCAFCSPCAPGAGYLRDHRDPDNGIKAYCFGHDWFESGKAPYTVYSVKTGLVVEPKAV